MKILVVENSAVLCKRLFCLLTGSGRYEVVGCANGSKFALALIETLRPDGLLLDLHLDEGSGFDLLAALRSRCLKLPVVIISEDYSSQYLKRALELGASAFLSKSGEFQKIIPTLDRLLGVAGAPQHDSGLSGGEA